QDEVGTMPILSGRLELNALDLDASELPYIEFLRCWKCGRSDSAGVALHPVFVSKCQACGCINLHRSIHKIRYGKNNRKRMSLCTTCAPVEGAALPNKLCSDRECVHLCDDCDLFSGVARAEIHLEHMRNAMFGRNLFCTICGETLLYAL